MMETKYRAWDIGRKQYEYINDLYWFEENMVHGFDDERYVFEQFTGLRDKNGREIYEGDVIKAWFDYGPSGEEPQYVAVKIGPFGVNIQAWTFQESFKAYQPEVIGNIHESPELVAKA